MSQIQNSVYEYEESITDDTNPILGKIITRQYNLGSRGIKKFVRGSIGYSSETGGSTSISVHTKTQTT